MKSINKEILLKALRNRLNELSDRFFSQDVGEIKFEQAEDFEEYLRLVMVKYYPKIKSVDFTGEEKKEYFNLLYRLSKKALNNDYRTLDAFNIAYEAIIKIEWSSKDYKEYIIPFFRIYKYLLLHHLNNNYQGQYGRHRII